MSDYNNSSNHISESILIQYFKMGFKLVPICDDGVTPNVSGLLTPEEQLISIQESKSGKVESVNYINDHPEFWTEERLRIEAYRFKNVATLPGKTRLETKDGNPLYLIILDIDSEPVFTILCRLIGSDGKDLYFIDRACKSTFVSKTKKIYGRHIFWLSDKQHRQIVTGECKPGYEFEIKTRFSPVALPESRHRDDPNFHYQKIGIDKIERFDSMYDRLMNTLIDCLKPKDDKYTNYSREYRALSLSTFYISSLYYIIQFILVITGIDSDWSLGTLGTL